MVPKMLRRAYQDIMGRCVEIRFAASAGAKVSQNRPLVLNNRLKKSLDE